MSREDGKDIRDFGFYKRIIAARDRKDPSYYKWDEATESQIQAAAEAAEVQTAYDDAGKESSSAKTAWAGASSDAAGACQRSAAPTQEEAGAVAGGTRVREVRLEEEPLEETAAGGSKRVRQPLFRLHGDDGLAPTAPPLLAFDGAAMQRAVEAEARAVEAERLRAQAEAEVQRLGKAHAAEKRQLEQRAVVEAERWDAEKRGLEERVRVLEGDLADMAGQGEDMVQLRHQKLQVEAELVQQAADHNAAMRLAGDGAAAALNAVKAQLAQAETRGLQHWQQQVEALADMGRELRIVANQQEALCRRLAKAEVEKRSTTNRATALHRLLDKAKADHTAYRERAESVLPDVVEAHRRMARLDAMRPHIVSWADLLQRFMGNEMLKKNEIVKLLDYLKNLTYACTDMAAPWRITITTLALQRGYSLAVIRDSDNQWKIGKCLSEKYKAAHGGQDAPQHLQYVDGAVRYVHSYSRGDTALMESAIREVLGAPGSAAA
jgi:DNA repair exonuclease SbcCD ATPase subunit